MNYKVKDQTGTRELVDQVEGVKVLGASSAALANDGLFTTNIEATAGLLIVKDDTTTDTATFVIVDTAGTVLPQLIGTQANFTTTADNAGTINVYVVGGVIVVQNKSGGTIDIVAKAYV